MKSMSAAIGALATGIAFATGCSSSDHGSAGNDGGSDSTASSSSGSGGGSGGGGSSSSSNSSSSSGGGCECPTGGSGACADAQTDPDNCGSCGTKCPAACVSGTCRTVKAIATGSSSACALLSGGTVECWGYNGDGELGDGTSVGPETCSGDACSKTPVVSALSGATAVAAGASGYFCGSLQDGKVECWGEGASGVLGNGTTTSSSSPVAVSALSGATALATSHNPGGGADGFSCALLSGGTVECWGFNNFGQLGNGTMTSSSSTPVAVSGLNGVTAIATGFNSACALLSGGAVECWGDNTYGELGNGTTTSSSTPVAVSGLSGATAVALGYPHYACALLSGGTVECWGGDDDRAIDGGTSTGPETCAGAPCATKPVAVSGLNDVTAIAIGSGYDLGSYSYACALLSGGTVECWGGNSHGELGSGTTTASSTPVAVSGLSGATAVATGYDGNCAVLSGGTVECWGDNTYGQLGNGTSTGPQMCNGNPCSMMPVAVSGLSGATAVATGNTYNCALLSGGTVECWGNNGDGQLGNGTTTNSSTPVAVVW